jgi:hypothetical protein
MAEVPGRSRSVSATRSIFGESIVTRKQEKNRAADVLGQEVHQFLLTFGALLIHLNKTLLDSCG